MSDDHNVKKQQYQFSQMNRTSTSPPARGAPAGLSQSAQLSPKSRFHLSRLAARDDDAQSLS